VIAACEASTDRFDTQVFITGTDFAAEVLLSDFNRRIQVLSYQGPDLTGLVDELQCRAREHGYGKVFIKAHAGDQQAFEDAGMSREAEIYGYFAGAPAVVMSTFLSRERASQPNQTREESILSGIHEREVDPSVPDLPDSYQMLPARSADAAELAALYRQVFASYPFPITDPDYLVQTMRTHVAYRIIRDGSGAVIAAASAETAPKYRNAEMTDFATLPDQRGLGLAQHLLASLEQDMSERNIRNLYTVARARSAGMNRVFHTRGYEWTGTLVNNCHIAGQFESMHIWCKSLAS
jgi:putative beta-lysine N-acetyltransferase